MVSPVIWMIDTEVLETFNAVDAKCCPSWPWKMDSPGPEGTTMFPSSTALLEEVLR